MEDPSTWAYAGGAVGAALAGAASYLAGRTRERKKRPTIIQAPPGATTATGSPDDTQPTIVQRGMFGSALDRDGHPLVPASDGSGRYVRVATREDLQRIQTEMHGMRKESRAGRTTLLLAIQSLAESMGIDVPSPSDVTSEAGSNKKGNS